MYEKPICYNLQIATLPSKDSILTFAWLGITKYPKEHKSMGNITERWRRTSKITHTEENGRWFVVETLNSTYTFMSIEPDEVFDQIVERLTSHE